MRAFVVSRYKGPVHEGFGRTLDEITQDIEDQVRFLVP